MNQRADPVLRHAANAVAVFEPLAALDGIALRNDAPALALRGIALAQLGEFESARKLLRRAAREFGETRPLAQARCLAASAEIALASRDARSAQRELEQAARILESHGDSANAAFSRLQLARLFTLLGQSPAATRLLLRLDLRKAAPRVKALAELIRAEIALRELYADKARAALARAYRHAKLARVAPLLNEIREAERKLELPLARAIAHGEERSLRMQEVQALLCGPELVIDARDKRLLAGGKSLELGSRPVLFALLLQLGLAFPASATRQSLLLEAFGMRRSSDSLRARLRVELARLRRLLSPFGNIEALRAGFRLVPSKQREVVVLLPPVVDESSALLALLDDGEAWATSNLAAALRKSQRSVQRILAGLVARGVVRAVGEGRARRWLRSPANAFATPLLLASTPIEG
ncbi:MAG: helix-turn-helix domain-containing protein [Myxococcota bacterium]